MPPEFVAQQLDAVLADIGVDAVKIGMLFSPELIEAIARKLREYRVAQVVLDPVMVAASGDKLLRDDAVAALKEHLIPLAALITPNLPEAAVLLDREIATREAMASAATALADLGCQNVLVKGGHLRMATAPIACIRRVATNPVAGQSASPRAIIAVQLHVVIRHRGAAGRATP